jgi:hypothetical protein
MPHDSDTNPVFSEPILPDDYPVYAGYWYVFDGQPMRSNYHDITVRKLKQYSGAREIRRCDAVARKLPLM